MHGNSSPFSSSTVAALLAVLVALALPAAAQLPWTHCGKSSYFSQNSTYQANLELASTVLPWNASSAASLFAAGSVGAVPDLVYALALCRGDTTNSSACAACLAVAFTDAQQLCAYSKEVAIYYDLCYLRFSNLDFLSGADDDDEMRLLKVENVSAPAAAFDAAVGALLNATAELAAADPARRFATGVELALGGSVPAIYALAQCTPDMTPASCRSCLSNIVQMAPKYFSGSPSGRVIRVRCNYRYELQQFFSGTPLLQLPASASAPAPARPSPSPPSTLMPENFTPSANGKERRNRVTKVSAAVTCLLLMLIGLAFAFILLKRRKTVKNQNTPVLIVSKNTPTLKKIERGNCAVFDLSTLQEATNNFHEKNKLGEGGFGTVYRGRLSSNGQEIAVKKLSRCTGQGLNQLYNEVQLLAELQHKNLVRLLGFCSHRDEMMLVYEHVKNGSLDKFLFDTSWRKGLNWGQKCNIILGIAKGILYLHEDSSLRIVHRDLKANNILLDENLDPKIADFGLARLLGGGHTQTKTTNVAGTYGYMAPEYALFGKVSPKTDVFSFGVLVLEIITGRRNSSSDGLDKTVNLLTEVWNCWTKGTVSPLINRSLDGHTKSKIVRCIHISLLCVQEHPDDRPNISSVIVMLTRSKTKLQPPRQPAFFFGWDSSVADRRVHGRNFMYEKSDVIVEDAFSVNDVTNTDPFPR